MIQGIQIYVTVTTEVSCRVTPWHFNQYVKLYMSKILRYVIQIYSSFIFISILNDFTRSICIMWINWRKPKVYQ